MHYRHLQALTNKMAKMRISTWSKKVNFLVHFRTTSSNIAAMESLFFLNHSAKKVKTFEKKNVQN